MDDIGDEGLDRARPDIGGGAAERGEALPVVRPVSAVRRDIGVAGAVEELRRIEDDEIEAAGGTCEQPGLGAEQVFVALEHLRPVERLHHIPVAGEHHPHLDVVGGERRGEGAGDVGETAGLDQREDLGGDREDAHRRPIPAGRSSAG